MCNNNIVGFLPKGVHVTVFFMAPIAIPVLGPSEGGAYILIELSIYLAAAIGVGLGKLCLSPQAHRKFEEEHCNTTWLERLKINLKDSTDQFKKIVVVFVPTVVVLLLLILACLNQLLKTLYQS